MKIIVIVGIILLVVASHEWSRYQDCLYNCIRQFNVDIDLLNRDVCTNAIDRLQFRDTVDCEGADRRMRLTVNQCALAEWRRSLEPVVWFKRLGEHFWVTVGIAVGLIGWGMYLFTSYLTQQHNDERFYKRQNKFVKQLMEKKERRPRFDNRITSR
jgi:hypothetical protein